MEHWEGVYGRKTATEVSWYTLHLEQSLRLIREVASPMAEIIDIGGGASTLVDDLLSAGYERLTVLDISRVALDVAKTRLGEKAGLVTWIHADITCATLPEKRYDVWHDRAVFHFLNQESDRHAYVRALRQSVRDGGLVIIAAFSLGGPTKCSGLEVVRYDAEGLQDELGADFSLTRTLRESHLTPAGKQQEFVFCRFQRTAGADPACDDRRDVLKALVDTGRR